MHLQRHVAPFTLILTVINTWQSKSKFRQPFFKLDVSTAFWRPTRGCPLWDSPCCFIRYRLSSTPDRADRARLEPLAYVGGGDELIQRVVEISGLFPFLLAP